MNWTMAQVIGHNVKVRREALGLTAAALGEKIGEAFGKPWPRQTVYMMESGDRAMVAQEVVALSQILDVPIIKLFTPPADVEAVTAGTLTVEAAQLSAVGGEHDQHLMEVAKSLRAIENANKTLNTALSEQQVLIQNAKNALLGEAPLQSGGDGTAVGAAGAILIEGAQRHYGPDRGFRDLEEIEREKDNGEG